MKHPPAVTSLPPSPAQERRSRMVKYSVSMGIRIVCILLIFVVDGWWLVLPILGAIVLPYVAVVIANVGSRTGGEPVLRPGALLPWQPEPQSERESEQESEQEPDASQQPGSEAPR